MTALVTITVPSFFAKEEYQEAIELMERGFPISQNQRQKATMRAILCFLYLACDNGVRAEKLAADLPRVRECREAVQPLIQKGLSAEEIAGNIKDILLAEPGWMFP